MLHSMLKGMVLALYISGRGYSNLQMIFKTTYVQSHIRLCKFKSKLSQPLSLQYQRLLKSSLQEQKIINSLPTNDKSTLVVIPDSALSTDFQPVGDFNSENDVSTEFCRSSSGIFAFIRHFLSSSGKKCLMKTDKTRSKRRFLNWNLPLVESPLIALSLITTPVPWPSRNICSDPSFIPRSLLRFYHSWGRSFDVPRRINRLSPAMT